MMVIEFKKISSSSGFEVTQIYEGRTIYKGTIGKQLSGLVIYEGLMISDVEQILSKMKKLQALKYNEKGVQIGNNNIQTNIFK